MKFFISVISAMLISVSAFCSDSLSVFYRIRLDGDIDAAAQRLVVLGLEKAAEAGVDYTPNVVYDRHTERKKREKTEIGMHSVRGGTIVGEHEVIFAGHDEVVTLSHSAQSREVFARGALSAAVYMKGKAAGMYSMKDVIESVI